MPNVPFKSQVQQATEAQQFTVVLELLHSHLRPQMLGRLLKRGFTLVEAEECWSEALVKVIPRLLSGEILNPIAYLSFAVMQGSNDQLRNRYEASSVAPLEDHEGVSDSVPSEAQLVTRFDVERAICQLPEDYQEVAYLAFVEECPQELIASKIQRSIPCVKKRLKKIRDLIRAHAEEGEESMPLLN